MFSFTFCIPSFGFGQCVARPIRSPSQPQRVTLFDWYQVILLGDRGTQVACPRRIRPTSTGRRVAQATGADTQSTLSTMSANITPHEGLRLQNNIGFEKKSQPRFVPHGPGHIVVTRVRSPRHPQGSVVSLNTHGVT